MTAQTGTQAVDRALAILVHVVGSADPRSFGSLVEFADLPKSTVSRLANALERQGLLERDPAGAFRPGSVLTRFARRSSTTDDLIETAEPFLQSLGRRTGETINLAIAGPDAVEQIAQVNSRYMLGATNWVGLGVPFHCSALGKIFLAYGVVSVPKGRLEQRTEHSLTTRDGLGANLASVRKLGYAVANQELEPGLVAIAAPIRSAEGTVIAAIAVSGPTIRLTEDRINSVSALVVAQAQALSAALGYSPRTFQSPKEGAA